MNLIDAVRMAKPFRRPDDVKTYGEDWWVTPALERELALSRSDILANDWEVQGVGSVVPTKREENLTPRDWMEPNDQVDIDTATVHSYDLRRNPDHFHNPELFTAHCIAEQLIAETLGYL